MRQREQIIEIKYGEGAFPPERHGEWIDLATPEAYKLTAGEFRILPFNIAMKLPDGYEGIIAPRSSTFKNYGILMANSIGVVENDYCGDDDIWGFPAYATRTGSASVRQESRWVWKHRSRSVRIVTTTSSCSSEGTRGCG